MTNKLDFTTEERSLAMNLYSQLKARIGVSLLPDDEEKIRTRLSHDLESGQLSRNVFGLNPIVLGLQTAMIMVDEIGLKRDGVLAVLLHSGVAAGHLSLDEVESEFGAPVARILNGLMRIQELYKKNPVVESENFRNLLLSFAEDMRVILIMIADRVNLMRQIRDTTETEAQRQVSEEAAYLYAPLAHKLGLYKLKSELEDLSLKYLEHDAYYMIREKLNATKQSRDAYIERFIGPISEKLTAAGLHFHIKGRTKSIHSIWQKMKKQKCEFEGVYDLFAIRIIIEAKPSPVEKKAAEADKTPQQAMHGEGCSPAGKQQGTNVGFGGLSEAALCWQAYSIVTDMYQPNPKRLRDWLSVPKSNGYESLHITVLGPEQKWVEVQIRTERMDEVAERGVAAHWRYKGIKGETGLDEWLTNIRSMLETADGTEAMDQFKMDLYEDEVFVFTPKGDLLKFPKGATVLDMAYHIHSKIGNMCVGARINNKVVTFRQQLHSGDQVEIMTASTQKPKQEWLNVVKTSRAKSKIRLALKETQAKEALFAKEMIERKFRNRKIDLDESTMAHLIRRLGYRQVSEFYRQVADGSLDTNIIIDKYQELRNRELNPNQDAVIHSANEFVLETGTESPLHVPDDVLVIDRDLKGLDYQLARCCNPIYGDRVFGFVTTGGGIKIHREDCPNAPELRRRFGYRVVKAKWSGKGASQYSIALRIVGSDDLGIVNNLTSIISKDEKLVLRSINIDSHDGLFRGTLVVMLDDTSRLEALIKKLRAVKGVKQVERV